MATLMAMLSYWDSNNIRALCLMGVTSALLTLSRIPDIAVLPIILVIIIVRQRKSIPILQHCVIGIIAFFITSCIVSLIIYGGIDTMLNAWDNKNIITGHTSLAHFMNGPKIHGPATVRMWLTPMMCILTGFVASKMHGVAFRKMITISIMLVLICFVCTYVVTPYCPGIFQFVFFALCVLGWVYNHTHNTKKIYDSGAIWITAVTVCIIPAIGSDIIVYRPVVIPAIPVLIAISYPYFKKIPTPIIRIFTISIFIIFFGIKMYSLAVNRFPVVGGKTGLLMANYSDVDFIRNINGQSHGKGTVHVGKLKYMYDYLTTDESGYRLHLFHYDKISDSQIVQDIEQNLCNYDTIMFTLWPTVNLEKEKYLESYRERLFENGFKAIDGSIDGRFIFIKSADSHHDRPLHRDNDN